MWPNVGAVEDSTAHTHRPPPSAFRLVCQETFVYFPTSFFARNGSIWMHADALLITKPTCTQIVLDFSPILSVSPDPAGRTCGRRWLLLAWSQRKTPPGRRTATPSARPSSAGVEGVVGVV